MCKYLCIYLHITIQPPPVRGPCPLAATHPRWPRGQGAPEGAQRGAWVGTRGPAPPVGSVAHSAALAAWRP